MTRHHQKELELIYAEKAAELLNEFWEIEPSPNETSWPDLLVKIESETFGLEVREIYLDESRKGSTKKAYEKMNLKNIQKLADAYYNTNYPPIKVDLLGNIEAHDKLLNAIISEVSQLKKLEQRRIELYSNCVIYLRRLPNNMNKYKRWNHISDKVGLVRNIDEDIIKRVILKKSKKLSKYSKNISDVRLLLVSNRIFNSGKTQLNSEITFDRCGFNTIYYLSYPETVWKLNN